MNETATDHATNQPPPPESAKVRSAFDWIDSFIESSRGAAQGHYGTLRDLARWHLATAAVTAGQPPAAAPEARPATDTEIWAAEWDAMKRHSVNLPEYEAGWRAAERHHGITAASGDESEVTR